ncbi:MAG: dipeptide epimerase [Pirellulales bacterium]|nr:dipeptide epimerase [Pirellulales bacterium]
MQLSIHRFELELEHPFTISRGTTTVQPTMIVELISKDCHGYGEATTNTYYGITWETMAESLESIRTKIETNEHRDPADFWQQLDPYLSKNRFAQCALDMAAHDLWGKILGKPVYRLWGLDTARNPKSNFTIGIDTMDTMVAKLLEKPDWPIYKIKLGTPDDVAIVSELRRHTDAIFRVDANCAWSVDETIENSRKLKPLGVQFIEQPLPADQYDAAAEVYARSALPIAADESCQVESDVDRCAGRFHIINIKLVKCGGMTPARRMIDRGKQLGMQTMVGCMTESTVGISAIGQLLPLLDYVDMDGAALLARDIALGVKVVRGEAIYPKINGNGVTLHQ